MRRAVSVVFCLLLLVTVRAAAGNAPAIQVLSESPNSLQLRFELGDLDRTPVNLAGGSFEQLSIEGGGVSGTPGAPELPVFARLVSVPEGARVSVRSTIVEEVLLTGVRPVPVALVDGEAPRYDAARYASSAANAPAATVGRTATWRDLTVAPLVLHPVRYDAAAGGTRVAKRIDVEVTFEGAAAARGGARTTHGMPASFARMTRELVVNAPVATAARGAGDGLTSAPERPGLSLIICPDNQAVVDSLARLVHWRTRRGIPTRLVTTAVTGASETQIRNYILSQYQDADTELEYVTLVGDVTGPIAIPTWFETQSGYNGEGDLPYGTLAGDDALMEVNVGRLSVEDYITLGRMIDKIIGYEASPEVGDTSWYTRACIVGDPHQSGASTVETGRWLAERSAEIGYTAPDTIFTDPFTTKMLTALNRGDTIFGYRGYYGMSGWSNGLTATLTNAWKMPFTVIITCDTGSFAYGTARSEGFFRGWNSTLSVPRGAIGAIGMATIGTHTRYNNCLYHGIWRGLLCEGLHTMGEAKARGNLELFLNYDDAEPWRVNIWSHWSSLMGDPAVDIYTAVPTVLSVAHPATVPVGTSAVTTTVTAAGGTPVEGALVCLWKGGETWVTGYTDAAGVAELPVATPTPGAMLVTVSGHNLRAYQGTINVGAPGLGVALSGSLVDDDASGESAGNGDGKVNPGETIELRVRLANRGLATSTNVRATMRSSDPRIVVTDSVETFPSLAPGDSAFCADDFGFTLRGDAPDGMMLPLALEIEADGFGDHALIALDVLKASLAATATTVYDDGGNGVLDPGESGGLSVRLLNGGHAPATAATGTLVSLSAHVTVSDDAGSFGTIAVGATGESSVDRFRVTADAGAWRGYPAKFQLITQYSAGAIDTTEFTLTVGTRTAADPTGPDRYGYVAFDNTDTAYPEAPTYSWVEIHPALGGSGTVITLGDWGEYQDKAAGVTLPFTFRYYGRDYTTATICSNGWLAFGSTILTSYRNWAIPGAGGPAAMIAAFWDDLYESAGNSAVVQWYDAANHRYIVEWSGMRNTVIAAVETFQLILLDPAFHPTESGDGIIVMQYNQVSDVDFGDGYSTTGIESPDQSDGLLYSYFFRYEPGAASLAAGRAIRYVPMLERPVGTLQGVVRNASVGGAPLGGAEVEILGSGLTLAGGPDGRYAAQVTPGTYSVVARRAGFAPDTTTAVAVQRGRVTSLDFGLVDVEPPAVQVSRLPSTEDVVGPYRAHAIITDPSGLAEKQLFYRTGAGSFTPINMTPGGGDDYVGAIPGQPWTTYVSYYVSVRDAAGLVTLDPLGAPAEVYSFAVAPLRVLADDGFESESGWTIGAPGDDATTGIWVRSDPVGTSYHGYPVQPESDHTAGAGTNCFVTGNANPGDPATTNDVDGGATTLLSPVFDLTHSERAEVSYWVWYSNHRTPSTGDDDWVVEVTADGVNWTALENTTSPTGETWVLRRFQVGDHVALTDRVQFRFIAEDRGSDGLVEAAIDDFKLTAVSGVPTGVDGIAAAPPRTSGLEALRPNPFAGETTIRFRVAAAGDVRLGIYDVAGRLVRTLVHAPHAVGEHAARWDGEDDAGHRTSPGIYFVRFETAGKTEIRRVTLVR